MQKRQKHRFGSFAAQSLSALTRTIFTRARLSATVIAAMLVSMSGVNYALGAPIMSWTFVNDAITVFSGTLNSNAADVQALTQNAVGPSLQDALSDVNATVVADASGNLFATNNATGNQNNVGGGDSIQQGLVDMTAATIGAVELNVGALASTGIMQNAVGPSAIQGVVSSNDAAAVGTTAVGVDTSNDSLVNQFTNGTAGIQGVDETVDALSLFNQDATSAAVSQTVIGQNIVGAPGIQNVLNFAPAISVLTGIMVVNTTNNILVNQLCLTNCIQNAGVNVLALSTPVQTLNSLATDTNVLGQNVVGGPATQSMGNLSNVLSALTGVQNSNTLNDVVINQLSSGDANQNADVGVAAVNTASQIGVSAASSINALGQNVVGGEAIQDMTNASTVADLTLLAQNAATGNSADVNQLNNGGNVNQTTNGQFVALNDLDQLGFGTAVGINVLNQNAVGADALQSLNNGTIVTDAVVAGQNGTAFNDTTTNQLNNGGDANQTSNAVGVAGIGGTQAAVGLAIGISDISQNVVGGQGIQDLTNLTSADGTVVAGQGLVAMNLGNALQVNSGGNANQDNGVLFLTEANGVQLASGPAIATSDIDQNIVGGPGLQSLSNGTVADDTVVALQNVAGVAGAGSTQINNGGDANQTNAALLGSSAAGSQGVVGDTLATSLLDQNVVGADGIQGMTNGNVGIGVTVGDQTVTSLVGSDALQVNNGGSANMENLALIGSGAEGTQLVTGDTTATSLLGQNVVGGSGLQSLTNGNVAFDTTAGDQTIAALGTGLSVQTNNGGDVNMGDTTVIGTTAGGTQVILGPAAATTVATQNAVGADGIQDMTNGNVAVDNVGGQQNVLAANGDLTVQTNNGGNANMEAATILGADADGTQVVAGEADAFSTLAQNVVGGSAIQGLDNDSAAADAVGALQIVGSGNTAQTAQTNNGGSANMDIAGIFGSNSEGTQVATGEAGAVNSIDQNAVGADALQAVDNEADAIDTVAAAQAVTSGNSFIATEQNNGGSANMNVLADLDANSQGTQVASGIAVTTNDINQNAVGGDAVQNVANSGLSADVVNATQVVGAANNVAVAELNNGGNANQLADVTADSTSLAGQVVTGPSFTTNTANQNAVGGDNLQNIDQDATAVSAVNGAQGNTSVNNIGVGLGCNGPVCSQGGIVDADANAGSLQVVDGTAGSTNTANQNGVGGDGIQNTNNATGAASTANGTSNNAAGNNIGVTEVCSGIVCAQLTQVGATSNAGLAQQVTSDADADTVSNQNSVGGDDIQNANNTTAAGSAATGNANNSAVNNVIGTQNCTAVVCAQGLFFDTEANAGTQQAVTSDADANTTSNQNGTGGTGLQNADNTTAAGSTTVGNLNNQAANNLVANQNCGGTVCAGFVGITSGSNAAADQNLNGSSDANTTSNQNNTGGPAIQSSDADTTAGTAVVGTLNNNAVDNILVNQNCGSTVCAHGATIGGTTNANAAQNLNGTSNANTNVNQNNTGGDALQSANVNNAANTVVTGTMNNNAVRNVGVTQTGGPSQNATVTGGANATGSMNFNSGSTSNTTVNQSN